METRTVEQVEGWKSRRFTDGYAGLRELSDGEFSGAVRAGGAWLFMLNGRVIGVHEGNLEQFEEADGTAYAAPHPSLPLLFSMRAEGGETQAKYYTNDTPLTEADSTLSQGGFTGYVELSENVLSGDYYVVYYGGRSMSVAFVGASEQVVSGDEAFERAADEVGIYEVRDVDIDVIDVPEPESEPDPATGGDSGSESEGATDSTPDSAGVDDAGTGDSTDEVGGTASGRPNQTAGSAGDESGSSSGMVETAAVDADAGVDGSKADASRSAGPANAPADANDPDARPQTDTSSQSDARPQTDTSSQSDARPQSRQPETASTGESATPPELSADPAAAETPPRTSTRERSDSTDEGTTETDDEEMFAEEEEWRETTTIPSLDPDRTEGADDASESRQREQATAQSASKPTSTEAETGRSKSSGGASAGTDRSRRSARSAEASASAETSASESPSSGPADESSARVEKLQSGLRQREQRIERLEDRLSTVQSEREELKRERDTLRKEVERLEARLESAEPTAGGTTAGGASRRLDPAQAFAGTNLFVRYQSKGEATLKEAAAGNADSEAVNANLRLEHHTQFEADDVAVGGASFEEFLTDSFEYRFVSWLVEDLLYEVRDTGHRRQLGDLYDAIPNVDRIDLHGSVSAGRDDEDTREESFDVIARDRMGNPLFVADMNDSRDPTTGEMMGSHVDAASGVAQAHDELAGAFQVTGSFFEPAALETAETATSGGFLSREKRESFVKLSRKRGYHLCLVESRSGGFHLTVPEL